MIPKGKEEIIYYNQSTDAVKLCLSAQDALHIPCLGLAGLVGYSPMAMAKNAIGVAMAMEKMR